MTVPDPRRDSVHQFLQAARRLRYPEAGGARRFCEALMEQGLLCKETHDNVIRFAPPLVISRQDIDWAIERIEPVLQMD